MTQLKYIWLDEKQIDDIGVAHLQELRGLQQLLLTDPQPAEERLADLKRALPRRAIMRPNTSGWR